MLGLLSTLNLAAQSLNTQMMGVEVAGQNLANVSTTGYSRQQVEIESAPDISTAAGSQGTGAIASSIQQIVSSLLNTQIQGQQSVSGYWNSQQTALQSAQSGTRGAGSASASVAAVASVRAQSPAPG